MTMREFNWDYIFSNAMRYKMNSSPRSDTDPYYECTMGSSMTPTVVSNFHLPNSNVNKNGPYLKILEQPQTKFRFRYKSEMVGTHGQLKAESSEKNKNIFPTVQLCNWHGGPALIRLMLYTAEDNANERKRHVHELNGKNCNKEGFTGGCEVVVDEENNFTAQFPNLGIIHIAKRDVQNIIFQRKKEELINITCMKNPGLRTESIQHNIPPIKLQKMKEEADEEAKMDLNKVVLRFQTFCYDNETNCYRAITEYIDSDVIFNLKNASTGELKIVRISAVSSPCSGKAEVWMLVEKVKKNNVRIKFYELDRDNQEIWKAYGDFKDNDVHHQYAIVFRTPPYRFTNIREPVHVKVQLERTTDNDTSEPLDFTYVPENLKRTNAYLDSKVEFEVNPQKRSRHSDMEAMDLKTRGNLFLESRDIKQPYSPEAPHQSPPQMVPSPITPADSPSSLGGFYSPPHRMSHNPSITVSSTREDLIYLPPNNEEGLPLYFENSIGQNQYGNMPLINPNYHIMYGGEHLQNGYAAPQLDECQNNTYYQQNFSSQMLSHNHQVPSPSSNGQNSPLGGQMSPYNQGGVSPGPSSSPLYVDQNTNGAESDDALSQIQQFDAVHKQVVHSKNQVASPHLFDFSDLVKSPVDQLNQNEDIDLLGIINSTKLFSASPDMNDIQADFANTQAKSAKESATGKTEGKDIESLTDKLSQVSVSEEKKERQENLTSNAGGMSGSGDLLSGKELSFRVALTAAGSLQSYAESGDINLLLATHRYLLSVQNNHGENSLHTAILSKNKDAFNKILTAATDLFCTDIVRAQNYAGETPLHLAVRVGESDMIKRLMLTPGCNVNALDADGNTCLHLAARRPQAQCLDAILTQLASAPTDKENSVSKIINLYNYHGQLPIHLAVLSGCLENVKFLLNNGALIHLCERKQGANSLHLSAMFGRHEIAKYLIENTSITVDAGLLDGNTALHIAAQAKDKEMCTILMSGKANPEAKNTLKKTQVKNDEENDDNDSDDEDDETSINDDDVEGAEDEVVGFTPLDYAQGDEEILSILRGKSECSVPAKIEQIVPATTPTCSTQNCYKVSINAEIDVSAAI